MPDPFSLFPAAPQPQAPLNPLSLLDAAGKVNALAQFSKDYQARQATGDAYAAARRPDGTTDFNRLATGLAARPATNWLGRENASTILEQRGRDIGNVASQYALSAKRQLDAVDLFGSIADKPTPEGVRTVAASLAARGVPAVEIGPMLDELRRAKGPAQYQDILGRYRRMAIGAAGTAQPVEAAPGPGLTPQRQPLGSALSQGSESPGGSFATGMPVGEELPAAGAAGRASDLAGSGSASAQYHADLENLKQTSKALGTIGGPTAEFEKKLAQLSSRFGLPSTMTPDQLKSFEEFDKIANQISTSQAGRLGAATDAGRHMVVGANPSTSMSSYGREGVIDMLQGNQDMIDRARETWLDAKGRGAPANSFDTFMHQFSKTADPRVFQFNRLNRENQQKFLEQLGPDELPEFERRYKEAIARKWVKPLKGQ
jgi:hypothetical protein